MRLRKQAHCVYQCEYHLVLVSKYRRNIFNAGSFAYFQELMKKLRDDMREVEVLTMNHDKDHIHLHLSIPPKLRISDVVRYIKSNTGRLMKRRYTYMRKAYYGTDGIWSDGYFVSTVGINEHAIQKYIEYQGKEDNGQATLEI